ncbi:MAG: isoleucine--tRNA ligase [Solirubrobacterales bacterium]|nr:isoleucine--tRNA ligase [Solirubrobacterales bacterium]
MSGFRPVDPKQLFPELEQGVLERWRERQVFDRQLAMREGSPLWSFYEGPPTANGRPGSHHVLARVFKDIYPRYKAMCGHYVPRKAGWDCHGLPVELEVEKELGIGSKAEIEEYGIAEFNARCRDSVFRYVEDWNKLTERIGFWIDLENPYVTMDNDYIESVWWALRKMWDEDRLYEGHKVVPYCPRCGTALSSHEVALGYHDVEDPSVYVRFPLLDSGDGESLLVWTTTPWTLPGNEAVAVAPEVTYARVRKDGEILILAEPLVEKVLGEGGEIVDRIPGSELVGRRYRGPVFKLSDREPGGFPVLAGDFVTTDDGTGVVHIAPAFGEDDYAVAAANDIFDPTQHGTLYNPVKLDGSFDGRVTGFEGRFVEDPELTAGLIESLRGRGLLYREEIYEHAYPHCWRCDTRLLYYAKSSWYVATSQVKERMLAANEEIGWHPGHIKDGRFGKWLEGNVDWALSRDRYWGTPLPIWECDAKDCDQRFCAGSLADIRERGAEVPEDLHRPHIDDVVFACEAEGCDGSMRRVPAVIDTWFDSGAMPFAQFHHPFENTEEFERRFPADFICEAIDQTRGWFYTLHAESVTLFDQAAYRNCVCLGLILDPEGRKMSKSQGNVVEPNDVIDRHGADAFRWYYLTAQQPWAGYRFSVDTVGEAVRQFLLTLWNTYSFWVLYANTTTIVPDLAEEFAAAKAGLGPEDFSGGSISVTGAGEPELHHYELDRWMISRLQDTIGSVRADLDDFDATSAGSAIADFVDDLSNWYLRLSRRRFWEGDFLAFLTLRHCLVEVSKLLAPFTPFLSDEIYTNLVGGAGDEFKDGIDSVHLCDFPEPDAKRRNEELEREMEVVRRTVELGRAARAHGKVKVRQPLRKAVIVASDDERDSIQRLSEIVVSELNVKELEFVHEEGDLVSYRVKPNYRALGPRFGSKMPQAAAAVEGLQASTVARVLDDGGEVGISVDGADHSLSAEEISLVMEPVEGYQVEAEAGHAVALALELDEELQLEGWAREIVHAVQGARKQAGLEVSDRIELSLDGDEELLEAARAHEAYLSEETLATTVSYGDVADGAQATIEGRHLGIALERLDDALEQ